MNNLLLYSKKEKNCSNINKKQILTIIEKKTKIYCYNQSFYKIKCLNLKHKKLIG